ncbi:Chaperone required for the assembly of the F1-ATPase [Roseovarius azorensis]|uniref:Chaperone required for the assembly of the F1-ATPase n=1 Tax=Roseovarius azorensis TaxID=1287727 RepID=A0A1H7PWV7_9RHOB|nr:ATP12 family protein [Roseovarius azorensis]SEL39874.1 Chaperone required for the assembly of the F1-ATPase [Roseovarius azorensis]
MSGWAARRFWKEACVVGVPGGYTVHLDGRPLRTPAKVALIVPTRALAEVIAAEWQTQEGRIDPDTMPFTRSANAALDKVAVQKAEVVQMLAAYGDSDLICYRAQSPAELVARQAEAWDPLLNWAESALAARLSSVVGVVHVPQRAEALENLHARVAALDIWALTAFHDLVSLSGSLVIGFAVLEGLHAPEDLWRLSRIDETWQEEQWGSDEEARCMALRKESDFLHAKRFHDLSRL